MVLKFGDANVTVENFLPGKCLWPSLSEELLLMDEHVTLVRKGLFVGPLKNSIVELLH